MKGQVFKIHSDFYYVHTTLGVVECKVKEILKKRKESVIVGDFVKIENVSNNQGFISEIEPRLNFLTRPKVANITKAIIVAAFKEPELDYSQLNRYIALCEYHNIKPVLCFNKNDLLADETKIEEVKEIYEPLGYDVIFTNTLLDAGVEPLSSILEGNLSILCGASGVGKSSIIKILSGLNLNTKSVSDKTGRGVHTTRHCEIFEINQNSFIVDTPGFSKIKFDFLMPQKVKDLFPEIKDYSKLCRYTDCLHTQEDEECNVIKNIDKIQQSRYDSYLELLKEAKGYKTRIQNEGSKKEETSKINQGRVFAKISQMKRALSRKKLNQIIYEEIDEETEE